MAQRVEAIEEPTREPATVGRALEVAGMTPTADGDVVLMAMRDGKPRHATLDRCLDLDPTQPEALYVASGWFAKGVITISGGRSTEHCVGVRWLPFDADLAALFDGDRAEVNRQLWAADQAELDDLIDVQLDHVRHAFAAVGQAIHRIDYTGYGVCAYVYVDERDRHRVRDLQQMHKRAVAALNQAAGFPLFDSQVSDAGPRVTRVPGSLNRKNPAIPRLVRTLVPWEGQSSPLEDQPAPAPNVTPIAVPRDGDGLSAEAVDQLVEALAPSWSEGQRHRMGLAVAGLLAKSGVPESQARHIVERLAANDRKPWDRFNALGRSYDRVRAGQAVAGWTALEGVVPVDAMRFVGGVLDAWEQSRAAHVDLSVFSASGRLEIPISVQRSKHAAEAPQGIQIRPLPAICLDGWLRDYVELVEPTCESPDAFHLAAGMALIGATMGRTVAVRHISKSLYANQYLMIVGAAGSSRKDTAIRLALDMPRHRPTNQTGGLYDARAANDAPYQLATDVGSAEGLVQLLSKSPNVLLYVTEYQRLIRNAKRQSTGTIMPLLTQAWDTPISLQTLTKASPLEAKLPCLSMIAAVQPGILAQETGQAEVESGYATRWLYVLGAGKGSRPEPPEIDEQAAYELYGELLKRRRQYEIGDRESRLAFADDARERWVDWYDRDRGREVAGEDEDAMRSRLGVHVRKVALIYAAGEGAWSIELRHLEAAIAFVEWCWAHTEELMRTWGVSAWGEIEARIQRVLEGQGAMPRWRLRQQCSSRRWGSREFGQVVDAMHKNGTVRIDPQGVVAWHG